MSIEFELRQAKKEIAAAKSRWAHLTYDNPNRVILDDLIRALNRIVQAIEKLSNASSPR